MFSSEGVLRIRYIWVCRWFSVDLLLYSLASCMQASLRLRTFLGPGSIWLLSQGASDRCLLRRLGIQLSLDIVTFAVLVLGARLSASGVAVLVPDSKWAAFWSSAVSLWAVLVLGGILPVLCFSGAWRVWGILFWFLHFVSHA